MRRREIKSGVKDGRLTVAGPWILIFLSTDEADGMGGVAVKCIDTIQNTDCEGSQLTWY